MHLATKSKLDIFLKKIDYEATENKKKITRNSTRITNRVIWVGAWHLSGIHLVVSSYACSMVYFLSYFIYNVLPLHYTFLSCSSHIVNTFLSFFFKVLAPGIWLISHNDVNTRSLNRTHRQCTCTRPVRQMPFRVKRLKKVGVGCQPGQSCGEVEVVCIL